MYKYTLRKDIKKRIQFYSPAYRSVKNVENICKDYGYPRDYVYWHVLGECYDYCFYSKKKLKTLYVVGYPLDVSFFDEEIV